MKRLQLIGKKKRFLRPEQAITKDPNRIHFLSLPVEIVLLIVEELEYNRKNIVSLSQTCILLNNLLNKSILFNEINLKNIRMCSNFRKMLKKNTRNLHLYVEKLILSDPVPANTQAEESNLNFALRSRKLESNYIEIINDIIFKLPNLKYLELVEVPGNFHFPVELSSYSKIENITNSYQRKKLFSSVNSYNGNSNNSIYGNSNAVQNIPTFEKLTQLYTVPNIYISAETGWSIPLRSHILWCFGKIQELSLKGIILDSTSFTNVKYLYDDNTKNFCQSDNDCSSVHRFTSPIESLILDSCTINSNDYSKFESFFNKVSKFSLINIKYLRELELIDYLPNLKELTIDFKSRVFSDFLNNYNTQFDSFFQMLCSKPNLKILRLINVSFISLATIPRKPVTESDTDSYRVCLYMFFTKLSSLPSIEVRLDKASQNGVVNGGLLSYTSFEKNDWSNIFAPIVDEGTEIQVRNSIGRLLFASDKNLKTIM